MGNSTIIYGIYVEYIVIPTTGWWFGTMDFYDFPFSWEVWNHGFL